MKNTAAANRKPNFTEVMDSLTVLCRAEKAGQLFCFWLNQASGNYEDSQTYLGELVCRTNNPVIAMLAKQAMKAR